MFTENEVKVIEGINTIPIFNIENVRGKCIITPNGNPQSLVLADDIAREGGLIRKNKLVRIVGPTNGSQSCMHNSVHTTCENSSSGFVTTKTYEYPVVMWYRFNQYANDAISDIQKHSPSILQYLSLPIKSGDYIPLEIALVVLMHCNSEQAREFHTILATKIAPELTYHAIQVYRDRLEYYKNFIDTSTVYSTTEVAREFEMSPQYLRKILQDLGIIYPCNKTWQISGKFIHCDFVRNIAINNGNIQDHPYWTDGGREFVIHILKKYGFISNQDNGKKIVPLVIPINQL